MALTAASTIDLLATPKEALEFVLDLDKYRAVDSKIKRVGKVVGPDEAGVGRANVWGRLKYTPPAPDVHDFELKRWSELTFRGAERQPGRLIFAFTGSFRCEPIENGTRLTHSYTFEFTRPFRFMEKLHRPWLQEELETELQELQGIFGATTD